MIPCVIADDLTGALDSGLQVRNSGEEVSVLFRTHRIIQKTPGISGNASCVFFFDTESRNCSSRAARRRLLRTLSHIEYAKASIIYKKIDSTLRGNIGVELDTLLKRGACELIVVAPALPFNERVTIDGIHYVKGVELKKTEMAKDLHAPIESSSIPEILSASSSVQVGLITLPLVRAGAAKLSDEVLLLFQKGYRIIVVDAEVDSDLEAIAKAVTMVPKRVLPCGSAGLLRAYYAEFQKHFDEESRGDGTGDMNTEVELRESVLRKSVVVVSASLSEATKRQIEWALAHDPDICLYRPDRELLFSSYRSRQKLIRRTVEEMVDVMKAGRSVILDGAGERVVSIMDRRSEKKFLRESRIILTSLSAIARAVLRAVPVGGLVLTGGDTAVAVSAYSGAVGLRITGQIEPYVPKGTFIGGEFDGLSVVTKAGGFGSDRTLFTAIMKSGE
jgi:D-threonate/D-erythronate kinase